MGRSMSVNERNLTMEDFRAGKFNMLITTNLLARGIDNVLVKWVVNFDLPQKRIEANRFIFDPDTYLHRSGRTGRFGRTGICMTLVN